MLKLFNRWRLGLLIAVILFSVLFLSRYQSLLSVYSLVPQLVEPHPMPPLTLSTNTTTLMVHSRFPQAIIIGVRKAGTRALLDMLSLHPAVVSPKAEVHYFNREENYANGAQWYLDHMPRSRSEQVTIEKTPAYFVHPDVPQRIHSILPNVKLLLIVRNPIERTVSDFAQLNNKKRLKDSQQVSIEEVLFDSRHKTVNTKCLPIFASLYDIHMKRWLELFKLSQFLVVNGDKLITNPVPELKKAEAFLGLQSFFTQDMFYYNETKGFYCWHRKMRHGVESHCLGSGKGREHPQVATDTVNRLKKFFKPHNDEFFKLSEQSFDW